MTQVRALVTYIAAHRIEHDGVVYETGAQFRSTDERAVAALRKAGALLLPTEVEQPEAVAQRLAQHEAELSERDQLIEQLRRDLEAAMAANAGVPASDSSKAARRFVYPLKASPDGAPASEGDAAPASKGDAAPASN